MNLLPNSNLLIDIVDSNTTEPTKTYKIDFTKNRVTGLCDGLEALKQHIILALSTNRYEHVIYTWNWGSELKKLVGRDYTFITVEGERIIREALQSDERILGLSNFVFVQIGEEISISFEVQSTEGRIEVKLDV